MVDIRRRLRTASAPSRDDLSAKSVARWTSTTVFVVLFFALVAISISADVVLVAILAGVAVSQMLYIALPFDSFRSRARTLWTGEAGEEAVEEAQGWWR